LIRKKYISIIAILNYECLIKFDIKGKVNISEQIKIRLNHRLTKVIKHNNDGSEKVVDNMILITPMNSISSDYLRTFLDAIEECRNSINTTGADEKIDGINVLNETQQQQLILSRLGQEKYRKKLLKY